MYTTIFWWGAFSGFLVGAGGTGLVALFIKNGSALRAKH